MPPYSCIGFQTILLMAPSLSKSSFSSSFNSSSFTLSNSTLRVDGHHIISQVPHNITITPSSHAPITPGCFLAFNATFPNSFHHAPLGKLRPIPFLSIYRHHKWRSAVWTGSNGAHIQAETEFILLDSGPSRPYVLFVPIIDGKFHATLCPGPDDCLSVCVESGSTHVRASSFPSLIYLHAGNNPFTLVKEAARVVRAHLGTLHLLEEKTVPGIIDKFRWCTRDEFDPVAVLQGATGLVSGGCPPGFVLLENGVQCMERVEMLVKALKEAFPSLEYVYVWHALSEYWRRVGEVSEIQKLHSHGIDGVKLLAVPLAESEENGAQLRVEEAYYRAVTASLRQQHFKGNGVIVSAEYCHNYFFFMRTQAISLACVGEDASNAGHIDESSYIFWIQGLHIVHCAYISLWMGNFILPDWDVFLSTHPCSAFHAASRAISGSFLYVADTGGNHNFELLKTLVLPDGSILRCEHYALPTRDCLFAEPTHDGKTLLKIWNLNMYTGVLGVFNCQGRDWLKKYDVNKGAAELSTKVNPKDIEWDSGKTPISVEGVELFALYFSQGKKLILATPSDSEEISLEPLNFELITVSPVTVLPEKSVNFAPIGLINMLNAGGALRMLAFDEAKNGVEVGIRGSGEMMVYASQKPSACKIDGKEIDFDYEGSMVKILIPWPGSSRLTTVQYVF